MSFLGIIIVATGFLALYWVFYGQRKYNDMFMPKRKTELKAVLFDLDGVIIDSFEASYLIFNDLRKLRNLSKMDKEEYRKKAWGKFIGENAKKYLKIDDMKEVEDEYNKSVLKHKLKSELMPDAEKVLETIKKKNIKVGLVTNTVRKFTMDILKKHKIDSYFDAIVTGDDVEKPKPYPDPILKACEKLNVMPDEVMYIGDTKYDYKAGKSAGAFVVGFNTHGDLMISNLNDILQLL